MQARNPADGYKNLQATPAQYTNNKDNAYFTQNGIARFGAIRQALIELSKSNDTSEETVSTISKIVDIIDGITDTSFLSTAAVGRKLLNLPNNLIAVFPTTKGAIRFNDAVLLNAAKILVESIGNIQPGELKSSATSATLFSGNVYKTIKSTMESIGAQINFFIQLKNNSEQSQTLYELSQGIKAIEEAFTHINPTNGQFIDLGVRPPKDIKASIVLDQINNTIALINGAIQRYQETFCTSITMACSGERLSPTQTFQLMLTAPGNLQEIANQNNLVGNRTITPTFLTTHLPFSITQLCTTVKHLLENGQKAPMNDDQKAATKALEALKNTLLTLQGVLSGKKQERDEKTLKDKLENFRASLIGELERYRASRPKGNAGKLAITNDLIKSLEEIDTRAMGAEMTQEDMRNKYTPMFTPESQFSKFIATVAHYYYQHNHHCKETKKSPAVLGAILVTAMNELAGFSKDICANDSDYCQRSLDDINALVEKIDGLINNNTSTPTLRM